PRGGQANPVVAAAGARAADAPDRVPEGEQRGGVIEQAESEELAPPRPEDDGDGPADHPAVPDEPRAGEEAAEQIAVGRVPVLDHVVDPGSDQAADQPREERLVRPVTR